LLVHVLAILGLALGCAGWVVFQRWMAKHHPELPGEERRLRGCGFCAKAEEGCDEEECEAPPDRLGPGTTIPVARLRTGKR
jgi:hypothetical protein